MKTCSIIKGCELLGKLNSINVKDDHFIKEFTCILDDTTKREIEEAIQSVLNKRKTIIEQEIKQLVNEA